MASKQKWRFANSWFSFTHFWIPNGYISVKMLICANAVNDINNDSFESFIFGIGLALFWFTKTSDSCSWIRQHCSCMFLWIPLKQLNRKTFLFIISLYTVITLSIHIAVTFTQVKYDLLCHGAEDSKVRKWRCWKALWETWYTEPSNVEIDSDIFRIYSAVLIAHIATLCLSKILRIICK